MQDAAFDKERNNIELKLFFVILVLSLAFVLWISRMSYDNTAIELEEQYIRIQTEDVISGIETSIRYGKELTNFYGIENELSKITDVQKENIGVVLLDKEGTPFVDVFRDKESGKDMLKAALTFYSEKRTATQEYATFRQAGVSGQFFVVKDKKNDPCGYLFVLYNRNRLVAHQDLVGELIPFGIILVLVMILLIVITKNINVKKFVPILILMLGLLAYILVLYVNFHSSYVDLVTSSATRTERYIQNTVDRLSSRGLPMERMESMNGYFESVAASNEAVGSIEVSHGKVHASVNDAYLSSKIQNMTLSFGAIFVICLMIAYELTFARSIILERVLNKKNKGSKVRLNDGLAGMIRIFSFLLYTAIYTSMPYAAVLIRNNEVNVLTYANEVVAPFPLTLELIAVLIIMLVGQRIYSREKVLRLFIIALSVLIVGNTACFFASSVISLILLRAFCGMGFAFLKLFLNTVVALGSWTEESLKVNFANLNGGLLGGITVGSSLGSILAGSFGYFANYIFTAGLIFIVLIFGLFVIPWRSLEYGRSKIVDEEEATATSLITVFRNAKVRSAMLFTDIPLNIGLMYVVSFLPVYMGVIGQPALATSYAYLINGLAGVYIGVSMIKLLKKLSVNRAFALSIFLGAGGILILLLGQNAFIVIISAAIMGLFDGFGTPTLTGYFTGVGNREHGDSAALLTLYGSVGSAVQIVCPILYGFLARPDGNLMPIAVFGVIFALFGLKFLFSKGEQL